MKLTFFSDLHNPFFDPVTIKLLQSSIRVEKTTFPYRTINVIEKVGDKVTAYSDSRGEGKALKFK